MYSCLLFTTKKESCIDITIIGDCDLTPCCKVEEKKHFLQIHSNVVQPQSCHLNHHDGFTKIMSLKILPIAIMQVTTEVYVLILSGKSGTYYCLYHRNVHN